MIGDRYKKSGKDLYYKTKLDFKTAILGGLLEYEHLDGKIYSIKIPEKTNTAARFKLKEKGLLINTNGNRGDLYIDIDLYVDYTKLKDEDIEILKKLK
jgi:DnaJ-class molecular chaperone